MIKITIVSLIIAVVLILFQFRGLFILGKMMENFDLLTFFSVALSTTIQFAVNIAVFNYLKMMSLIPKRRINNMIRNTNEKNGRLKFKTDNFSELKNNITKHRFGIDIVIFTALVFSIIFIQGAIFELIFEPKALIIIGGLMFHFVYTIGSLEGNLYKYFLNSWLYKVYASNAMVGACLNIFGSIMYNTITTSSSMRTDSMNAAGSIIAWVLSYLVYGYFNKTIKEEYYTSRLFAVWVRYYMLAKTLTTPKGIKQTQELTNDIYGANNIASLVQRSYSKMFGLLSHIEAVEHDGIDFGLEDDIKIMSLDKSQWERWITSYQIHNQ